MIKSLKPWQWLVLVVPIALPVSFILIASAWQIHQWGINWVWAIFIVLLVIWRSLLVRWTKPALNQLQDAVEQISQELDSNKQDSNFDESQPINEQLNQELTKILEAAQNDQIIWQDWQTFLTRCQEMIVAIAGIYHPEVKRPLLNIYVPQAYSLIRGTVDDTDRWMTKLSPALNQLTIGQAYEAYETYQRLEPSAKKLLKVWDWAQWIFNPAAAVAKQASRKYNSQANQQLITNLSQLFRETALRNLSRQAIALYSGDTLPPEFTLPDTPTAKTVSATKTQTLREIIEQTESTELVEQETLNILVVGRTGAGKSSLINTLFQADLAAVDVLPNTDRIAQYHWTIENKEALNLWDTPGYEQAKQEDLRQLVLDFGAKADLILLVTPALDPALKMDLNFLEEICTAASQIPVITVVTQVDKLRPIKEWQPPYDWQQGISKKELNIRNAIAYRQESFGEYCDLVLPLVAKNDLHSAWGSEMLSLALIEAIAPSKKIKLANFISDREAKIIAASQIIDRYALQMSTTQGITNLLKSPILQFLSTMTTGNSALAYALAEQIPIEQLPLVIGKLQMAYDLYLLLVTDAKINNLDFLAFWPLLIQNTSSPSLNSWAFGHSLFEYWSKDLPIKELQTRFDFYLKE